jgi:hypothetical protein
LSRSRPDRSRVRAGPGRSDVDDAVEEGRDCQVCRYVAWVISSCGLSILMEETAEAIATLHQAVRPRGHMGRFAWPALPETLVRSSLVIVLDELVQHPRQMMPPEDQ